MHLRIHHALAAGLFLACVSGAAMAQTASGTGAPAAGAHNGKADHHAHAEKNASCRHIKEECQRLGFRQGRWKEDEGLWKDCFDPVVKGTGQPTKDGHPVNVPVSAQEIQECRAHMGHHGGNSGAGNAHTGAGGGMPAKGAAAR
jgi:hypothetical protein